MKFTDLSLNLNLFSVFYSFLILSYSPGEKSHAKTIEMLCLIDFEPIQHEINEID